MLTVVPTPFDQLRKLYGDDERARKAYDLSCKSCELANLSKTHPVAMWADDRMCLLEAEIHRLERDRRNGWESGPPDLEPLDQAQMAALQKLSLSRPVAHWALLEIQGLELRFAKIKAEGEGKSA
jgi:hypothetical protein